MKTQLWEPRSFIPHSKNCTRVTKENANAQKKKQKQFGETVQLVADTKAKYSKHKSSKNKHSMDEATRMHRLAKETMPDSDDSDVQPRYSHRCQMLTLHT